jgi:sporulation protein YlmC with PRC-barrel domain
MEPTWHSQTARLLGEPVVDRKGERIGTVAEVAFEPNTLAPEWLVVKTSIFGRRRLVPIESAQSEGDTIRVPYSKETVLDAPVPEIPGSLATRERTELLAYYQHAA